MRPAPGHILTPKPNSRACPVCTILVRKNAEPPECILSRCPRKLVPAPTNEAEWIRFIASAPRSCQ